VSIWRGCFTAFPVIYPSRTPVTGPGSSLRHGAGGSGNTKLSVPDVRLVGEELQDVLGHGGEKNWDCFISHHLPAKVAFDI